MCVFVFVYLRMWVFVLMACLLDQNQASPLPWQQGSLQPVLQQQVYQTSPPSSAAPAFGQQRSSSSSSSSSSSASSDSSHSSEGVQQLRDRQRLENTAVEQIDSSQESWELLRSNASEWISELVLLGQRVGDREGERDTGDDSVGSTENRQRAMVLTFHPLLARPRLSGGGPGQASPSPGGATGEGGGAVTGDADAKEGGVNEFPQLLVDSSTERGGLTFDSPGHAHNSYFGNEEGLELGL